MASHLTLPLASSADLVLTHPTAGERRRIWSQNFTEWGRGLTRETYLDREAHILDIPMSQNGGLTNWILTTAANPAGDAASEAAPRPILASCETLRRRVMVSGEDGAVRDTWGYGVASVFTFKDLRGRGYAGRMMAMLHDHLAELHRGSGDSPCSVLYSDIGKKFYAAHGWLPDRSTFLEFPVKQTSAAAATNSADGSVKPIKDEDVPALAEIDEALLRRDLSARKPEDPYRVRLAFVPSAELHQWHFHRDDFYCKLTFSRTPTVRGAVYTMPGPSPSRVWIFWTRVYNGGVERPEKNVLYINRFVVESESVSDAELSKAIVALWGLARKEAEDWQLAKINMWNPSDRVRRLVGEIDGLEGKYVVREEDSIASLSWFGEGSTDQVEWVANERYAWC